MIRGSHRAITGNSVDVTITPRRPMLNFEAFLALCWTTIRRVGRNAATHYGRFTYTISFNVTMRKPTAHPTRSHTQDEVTTDFVLYPSRGRTVTAGSLDFAQEGWFAERLHFDDAFNGFSNHNGSGFSLVSVNSCEINFVKSRVQQHAGKYFEPPVTKTSCVNVPSDDEKCFMWSILAAHRQEHLQPATRRYNIPHTELEQYIDMYNWNDIEFPAHFEDACDIFEENNKGIALHVWRRIPSELDDEQFESFPIRVSPRLHDEGVKHIDLYYAISDAEKEEDELHHYLWIQRINSFVYWEKKGKPAELCRACVRQFMTTESYLNHLPECGESKMLKPVIAPARYPEEHYLSCNTEPISDYIVVHTESVLEDGRFHINRLQYVQHKDFMHPDNKRVIICDHPRPVHWFMDQMRDRPRNSKDKIPVLFKDAKVVHQMMSGLDGYDISFDGTQHFGTVDENNMTSLDLWGMRYYDSSKFFKCDAGDVTGMYNQWEEFRAFCLRHYGLEPLRFYTAPSLAWNAALKYSNATPEYIAHNAAGMKLYDWVHRGIRGAINIIPQRIARADHAKGIYLANFDIKSAYGWSMKQPLPYSDYRMVDESELSKFTMDYIQSLAIDGEKGYILEVDLECPAEHEWHDDHAELPLAPDKMDGKLRCTLLPKINYVVHYRLLSFYIGEGMTVKKVHGALEFTQKTWLRSFMELQEQLRNEATPAMNKVIKLMTNTVFGRSIRNVKNNTKTKFFKVSNYEGRRALANDRTAVTVRVLSNELIATTHAEAGTRLEQHPAVGMTILELGKLQLYRWWYDRLRYESYGMKLLYCDTDSLIVEMGEDPREFMKWYPEWFTDHVGNLKEESGEGGVFFIGCKPKHYLYETQDTTKVRLSGLTREAAENVSASDFREAIEEGAEPTAKVRKVYTDKTTHEVTVRELEQHYLNDKDTTRHYITPYESVPFGHYRATDTVV